MTIEKLKQIMRDLRDPKDGCPWDIEQDFQSIAPHTIEEAYEVVNAIDNKDYQNLKEELGDLLLQVIFHSQIAKEEGMFDFEDVVQSISEKMISRHPHVFGREHIKDATQQEKAWEMHKQKERENKSKEQGKDLSILDDVAIALPAITRSVKLQKRAAKVGFDWDNIDDVFAKIDEEMQELKEAISESVEGNIKQDHIEEEYGDLLFVMTNLGRKLKLDPEIALKKCNNKFITRFNYIENSLKKDNIDIKQASLKQMEILWNEAKKLEKKND